MEIRFFITEQKINSMTVEDFEAFERAQDGDAKLYRLRPVLCKFMVDENDQPIPFEEALKISKKMNLEQGKYFIEKFFEAVKLSTVPKAKGSPSTSLSPVQKVDSGSQDG